MKERCKKLFVPDPLAFPDNSAYNQTEIAPMCVERSGTHNDTVHEMAKDEARHGKAFEGLLKRYFK